MEIERTSSELLCVKAYCQHFVDRTANAHKVIALCLQKHRKTAMNTTQKPDSNCRPSTQARQTSRTSAFVRLKSTTEQRAIGKFSGAPVHGLNGGRPCKFDDVRTSPLKRPPRDSLLPFSRVFFGSLRLGVSILQETRARHPNG